MKPRPRTQQKGLKDLKPAAAEKQHNKTNGRPIKRESSSSAVKKRTDKNESSFVKSRQPKTDAVHVVTDRSLGHNSWSRVDQIVTTPLLGSLSSLAIYRSASPFDRRIMSIAWFPSSPNKLAIGSKAGAIYIWDVKDQKNSKFIARPDYGPGYSIFSMKFHRTHQNLLLIGCGDGTLSSEDVETTKRFNYEENFSRQWTNWFCSVESSHDGKLVLGGDNHGGVGIYSEEGKKGQIRWMKLHKMKVTHIEFNAKDEWLLATSSVDRTVKMWDVRKLNDRKDCLQSFTHAAGVNNATFNPRDGTRMLTTDQSGQIRVYNGPLWTLSQTISHPHRQFQHLTPIKASWHPLNDILVVGRYPNPKSPDYIDGEPRTIDFFGAHEGGKELLRISDCDMTGIVSLNDFNLTGEIMASAMGYNVLIWKPKRKILTDENNHDDEDGYENTERDQVRKKNGSKTKHSNKSTDYFRVPASKKKKQT